MAEGKLYFAYGSNINLDQMAQRCPDAQVVGPVTLENYEGYPRLYGKEPVTVRDREGQEYTVMAYVMTELCKEPSIPSFYYYGGILEGYRQNGLPTQPLKQAWEHCVEEVHQETERINRRAGNQLSSKRKKRQER